MNVDRSEVRGQRTTVGEFDRALSVAESLLRQVDRIRERARLLRVGQVATLAFTALVLTILLASNSEGGFRGVVVTTVGVVASLLVVAALQAQVLTLHRQLIRDERAITDIVGTLRELLPFVSDEEHWSHAQSRLVRTRIARFPIDSRTR